MHCENRVVRRIYFDILCKHMYSNCANLHYIICARLDGAHVVFGKVVEVINIHDYTLSLLPNSLFLKGYEVVKAMEKVGSEEGNTSKKVEITCCGQINNI